MPDIGAGLSTHETLREAIGECVAQARTALDAGSAENRGPTLAILFVSPHHVSDFGEAAGALRASFPVDHIIGCSGETIVGGAREVEGAAATSLLLLRLSGGETMKPFKLVVEQVAEGEVRIHGTPDLRSVAGEVDQRQASVLLLGTPGMFPADQWLAKLNEAVPGLPVYGGMASGLNPPNNAVMFDDEVISSGAVGVYFEHVKIRSVVSQGCRPIGPTMVVTKSDGFEVGELAGKPALSQLQKVFESSNDSEKELLQRALHVGQVVDERISQPGRGDFLVRNVVQADPDTGAITVGDIIPRGRTVRFHVRDSASADEDLTELLGSLQGNPKAALLFSCNGRGTRLFDIPDHDAACIRGRMGDVPVAGFFAMGEIGPVGGRNFLHGFTASVVVFE